MAGRPSHIKEMGRNSEDFSTFIEDSQLNSIVTGNSQIRRNPAKGCIFTYEESSEQVIMNFQFSEISA